MRSGYIVTRSFRGKLINPSLNEYGPSVRVTAHICASCIVTMVPTRNGYAVRPATEGAQCDACGRDTVAA